MSSAGAPRSSLDSLDAAVRARVLKKLRFVTDSDDPRTTADPLTGVWTGFRRYRVGDYRVICRIADERVAVYVIEVGHRREVYR